MTSETVAPAQTTSSIFTVVPTADGSPAVCWEMTAETADTVLTMLARSAQAGDPGAPELLDALYLAVSEATDFTLPVIEGCPGLWADAIPMALVEPAILGNDTGTLLSVLIPGRIDSIKAVTLAVEVANEGGAALSMSDVTLMADVHPERWMVLNTCESDQHDFHPELAAHGQRTTGAVLITRVDLSHD